MLIMNRDRFIMALSLRLKRGDVDMTSGNIFRHIIGFALPLFVGNLFQLLYNMVDAWVVGNYVSNEAFSAVGTVGTIINMLIGFFSGLATGAGVVISQYYGAKQESEVRKAVHTSILMTLALGVIFTALGIFMTPLMLRLMKTPGDVVGEATTYLVIYFAGLLGLMLYNMGAGILRAVGDSRHPFYYLVVCAVLNTVLDLTFVLVFHMGVAGVALATIIAEFVSAALILLCLARSKSVVRLCLADMKISWKILWKIVRIGFPAGIQVAITAFSNVFVQSYINHFGKDVMSGHTAYGKIDSIISQLLQSIEMAVTTFVGQNLGVSQVKRAKNGIRTGVIVSAVVTVIIGIPIMIFAPYAVAFFNPVPAVVEAGTTILRILTPFFLIYGFYEILVGALRGAGNSTAPMIITLATFVGFRQVYLYVMSNFVSNDLITIFMGFPISWTVCMIILYIYYKLTPLDKNRIIDRFDTEDALEKIS